MRLFHLFTVLALAVVPFAAVAGEASPSPLTAEAIDAADLSAVPAEFPPSAAGKTAGSGTASLTAPDPAIIKLQVLLDRADASPGVIDGFDGDNFRKAVSASETMNGLKADGAIGDELIGKLPRAGAVTATYIITDKDVADLVPQIPTDYAEMAKLKFLGYVRISEELGERFHMDEKLLVALNPNAQWAVGESITVVDPGPPAEGKVARLEADKSDRQLCGYDASGRLLVAYPATIGSEDNPSPTGTHLVDAIARMPNYTYDPSINFKQGNNSEKLIIPPGPNGPVGSMWIDLTEPTFGIHGTPEPSKIDKTNSHGCVRLTNWDAEELAKMVEKGVPVEFID